MSTNSVPTIIDVNILNNTVPNSTLVTNTIPTTETMSTTTEAPTTTVATTTTTIADTLPNNGDGYKFPYAVVMIITIWLLFAVSYLVARWRQKVRPIYIIPRVFVLCSPRTVQFHYELILRVGLPSPDFNPDKHDIDITILGQTKNEVVPMTRLNTKTLTSEPLITSLSIVVYRLVEMPPLGSLILRHSGPFKSWIFAYDFTIIDLSTNKEQYYTLNQYIGSLNRLMVLREVTANNQVHYPIDDVPLPQWTMEDVFLFVFTVFNFMMLIVCLMPINCNYTHDIVSTILTALGGVSIVFFLEWFFYFYMKWNQDRRDFFNDYTALPCIPNETIMRLGIGASACILGAACIYLTTTINDYKSSLIWLLVVINSSTLVIGAWNIGRQLDLADNIVGLGLRFRQIETVSVGLNVNEMIADMRTKSGSTNSEDGNSSSVSYMSKVAASRIGPRSSVKSYGFDPTGKLLAKVYRPVSKFPTAGGALNGQPMIHGHNLHGGKQNLSTRPGSMLAHQQQQQPQPQSVVPSISSRSSLGAVQNYTAPRDEMQHKSVIDQGGGGGGGIGTSPGSATALAVGASRERSISKSRRNTAKIPK